MPQQAQSGRLVGRVYLKGNGQPIHYATVMVVELGRVAETDEEGTFAFPELPPGSYSVVAYTNSLATPSQLVELKAGQTARLEFGMDLSPIRHEITVTAKGKQETAFEAIQSVNSLDPFDIAERQAPTIGEVLEDQPGVAKRSFGPGSSRPVVRGFDGDRVLVMEDGVRVGSLGSQSGDHGEPINPASLDRLEVVKGPATLLYGSNAIGGVVNAVTGHHEIHTQPHEGWRGQLSGVAGSGNEHLGGNASVNYGIGKWMFWGGGGAQRTEDYDTPEGTVENSETRVANARFGGGWYGEKAFSALEYSTEDGRFGIPFAAQLAAGEAPRPGARARGAGLPGASPLHQEEEEEELEAIDLDFRRHHLRYSGGLRNLEGAFSSVSLALNYTDWAHNEVEALAGGVEEIATTFDNRQFVYRAVVEQSKRGLLTGSFGAWGLLRDYDVSGEEALSPPVDKSSFALFTLQELGFEKFKLQFGGRFEHNSYQVQAPANREVDGEETQVALPDRDFSGASAGAGARFELWPNGAFVANFVSSHRAPALEELYNFGPHLGILAFEIGNARLERERSNGFDLSLRHFGQRLRAQANFFYYDIGDFVFLAPTGLVRDGLIEAQYLQGDSRFLGTELQLDLGLRDYFWFKFALDAVDAELTESGQPLPRIPPLRARLGLDFRHLGLSVRPELELAAQQDDTFVTETPTAGYGVVNLNASYTLPGQHLTHHFSVQVFNIGDQLYRNHVSFIKDLAPEIGRGVRFSYVMDFF